MQLTKRRLSDLWIVGREVTFDDGQGEPIKIWIQKMNPAEADETARRCNAARARVLATKRDRESQDWQTLRASVTEIAAADPNRVIEFLLSQERAKFWRTREAQIANEEEWSKDNYLQGLRDAWADGLEKRYAEDPDDPEASHVFEEMERFSHAVTEAVEDEIEALRSGWSSRPIEQMEDEMAEKLLEIDANEAWVAELRRCQIFYAVRDPDDHKKHYFESTEELDLLSAETLVRLRNVYDELEVDVAEGKGSPAPTLSSQSSEQPSEAATAQPSGLVGAGR